MREHEGRIRPPSIRDVAEKAGVSYQTVSRVLNEHPSLRPDTVDRVQAAIQDLGYRPNRAARALVTSRNHTIGVLLTARALHGPFSSFITIVDAARERGYTVTTVPNASDDPGDIVEGLDALLMHGVEGIVAIAPQDRAREAVRQSGATVPVLTLQGRPDEALDFGFDQQEGARLAVRHLLALGHRRILHLPGPSGWAEAEQRQAGYEAIMREHGLEPLLAPGGDWTADSGRAIALEVLDRERPTAVFATNDEMAVGLLAAAADLGLRVPEDLSVVGFDDVPFARHLRPALTTVRQDFGELGRRAIAALIDEIEQTVRPVPHPRVLPHLVVRDSTAQVTIATHAARSA
ncbi:LacI family DNA-binding transcriptional regulator [Amnibacterium sp.]|uniref:LacI family DNA-binding transcriptional regulator n=1 Tax=Amnibacterium sp. TaxID=1872496 RepID=UPI003F7CCC1A